MEGWISIHRKLQDNWVWQEKPFSRGQAWIDLLLLANHDDNKFLLGNELIEVKRGQKVTSEVKLAERWGWSRTKVRSFLELLQNDNMIVKKSDNKKTVLTIVNYNDYQYSETAKEQQKNIKRTAEEQQKNTNNNDNNDNNENNYIEQEIILTQEESEYISILAKIKDYPLDRKKDLEYMATMQKRYPNLDLIESIKKFSIWVLDNPFKKNANYRSQINTSFSKYVEWGICKKQEKTTNKKVFEDKNPFLNGR